MIYLTMSYNYEYSYTILQYGIWRELVAVGGRSSVVRALAAQASDLGSIPGGFPARFFSTFPFQPVLVSTSY